MVDSRLALWPLSSSIKVCRQVVSEHSWHFMISSDCPGGVYNRAHEALDFFAAHAVELAVDSSSPGASSVVNSGDHLG